MKNQNKNGHITSGYIEVSRALIAKIGLNAATIFGTIESNYNFYKNQGRLTEAGFCYITYARIKQNTGISESTARKCVKQLEEVGLIECMINGYKGTKHFRIANTIDDVISTLNAEDLNSPPIKGFIQASKLLIQKAGLKTAILYGSISSICRYWSKRDELVDGGYCFISYQDLYKATGIKERTARKYVDMLVEIGLIECRVYEFKGPKYYKVIKTIDNILIPADLEITKTAKSTEQPVKNDRTPPVKNADTPPSNLPTNNLRVNNILLNNKKDIDEEEYINLVEHSNLNNFTKSFFIEFVDKIITKGLNTKELIKAFETESVNSTKKEIQTALKQVLDFKNPIYNLEAFVANTFLDIDKYIRINEKKAELQAKKAARQRAKQNLELPPSTPTRKVQLYNWLEEFY